MTARAGYQTATRRVRDGLRRDPDDVWAAVFGRMAACSFVVAVILRLPIRGWTSAMPGP
jgi:hypothetical protein